MCRECAFDSRTRLACRDRLPHDLRELHLFQGLSEAQLTRLLDGQRSLELPDGQWLFREGDPASRFFVVRSGEIALFHQSEVGKESVVTLIGPDEVFEEELAHLEHARHGLNARAVGACTVLSFDRRVFRDLLAESSDLALRLLATQHRRQHILLEHIQRLTLQDATERLVSYLLEQERTEDGKQRIRLRVPKHTLAAHLSIQPETLSRILQRLRAARLITQDDDALQLDVEALRSELQCLRSRPGAWGCPGPVQSAKWSQESARGRPDPIDRGQGRALPRRSRIPVR